MTLSDDDKQFIKDTIDYRIKRGSAGKGGSSDTESGKKLSKLEYEEREKKNRELLLKELKERDKRGENTIAQKVEMLNLSMKQAIPDDFKEAMQQTGSNIKKGTSQVGRGLNHLTDRAMMSNPLTAMLWQNRDIAKAAWDVGAGSVRAVAGGIAGIGRGAAGLVNNAINMFRRKKKNEEIPEDEAPEFNENKPQEQEETDEKSMADKINEMHEWIFKHWKKDNEKKDKEQKEQKDILSKGLAGLGKSMKAVNGFVEMIQAKQKLIVTGLILGVAAIVGLVAWFKSGGLEKAIKGIIPAIINGVTGALDKGAEVLDNSAANNIGQADRINNATIGQLNSDLVTKIINKDYGNNTVKMDSSTQQQDRFWHGSKIKDLKKAKILDAATNRILEDPKHNWANFNASYKQFSTTGNGMKLAFPVKIKILDTEFNKDGSATILIEKSEITSKGTAAGIAKQLYQYADQKMPRLIVTRVLKILVPTRQVIPANTPFVVVDKSYQIIGDLSAFMKGEKYEEYQNNAQNADFDKNYVEFMNKKGMAKKLADSEENFTKKETFKAATKQTAADGMRAVSDWAKGQGDGSIDDNYNPTQPSPGQLTEDVTIPNSDMTGTPKAETKIDNNNTELKKQDKEQKEVKGEIVNNTDQKPPTLNVNNIGSNGTIRAANIQNINEARESKSDVLNIGN